MEEQANNKRTNVYLELNGKRQTIRQWEKELGFGEGVIKRRRLSGWTVLETLTTKPQARTQKSENKS